MPKLGRLRIIGGQWRRRLLPIPAVAQLRPSPDRARETLFNWLRDSLPGKYCLDLFAGTGALGFEAASHGAAHVSLLERDSILCANLKHQAEILDAEQRIEIICADTLAWLQSTQQRFDVVFLDPPFAQGLVAASCELLCQRDLLHPGAQLYVESERGLALPSGFKLRKTTRIGQLQCSLLTI